MHNRQSRTGSSNIYYYSDVATLWSSMSSLVSMIIQDQQANI